MIFPLPFFLFLGVEMSEMASASDAEGTGQPYFEIQNLFDAVHYIDDFLYICDLVSVTIGIPLNLVVIGAILLVKRLHLQRNFIWIGIGTSNIIVLASHLVTELSIQLGSSASARALSAWFVALSTATRTVNISFAHLERYMCINHLPLCLAGQIAVMRTQKTRLENPYSVVEKANSKKDKSSSHFVVVGNNRVRRQDLIAAQNTFLMSKVYLLFQTSIFISVALAIGCVIGDYSPVEGTHDRKCSSLVQGFYYTCGISSVMYSSMVDPIAFVTLSSDFVSWLKSRIYRRSAIAKELEHYEMTQI